MKIIICFTPLVILKANFNSNWVTFDLQSNAAISKVIIFFFLSKWVSNGNFKRNEWDKNCWFHSLAIDTTSNHTENSYNKSVVPCSRPCYLLGYLCFECFQIKIKMKISNWFYLLFIVSVLTIYSMVDNRRFLLLLGWWAKVIRYPL